MKLVEKFAMTRKNRAQLSGIDNPLRYLPAAVGRG
jgi:hypothetical protein